MSISQNPGNPVSILAVVVLYKRAPSESRSLCSLNQILDADPELARHFSLLIYDHSPQAQNPELNAAFPATYRHDPTNAGLANAYNFALGCAHEEQHPWLLLLDQDASPSSAFLHELVACAGALLDQEEVASIVPKLLVAGRIFSPAEHFIDQLRHQYRRSNHAVAREVQGVQRRRLSAYNSGATLRVSALEAIGGFPEEFWLDYLDHAVFHSLSAKGYAMYVMEAEVDHDASQGEIGTVPVWRQRNLLAAQTLFVKKTANFADRLLYRIWVLRSSRILWLRHPDKGLWKEAAIEALLPAFASRNRGAVRPPARDS